MSLREGSASIIIIIIIIHSSLGEKCSQAFHVSPAPPYPIQIGALAAWVPGFLTN
jgi:hypothetical protein